ncbi:MAG: hypothetical protein K6G84_15880 [Lachnospiraceae bacterium]|nr:hypothetical protein [Lachnospiraceae bacterium]
MADSRFEEAINGKKIPLLTLDNKWHKLFTHSTESRQMHKLAERLNELIERQGKLTTEFKDLKKVKSDMMNNIMSNMNVAEGKGDRKAEKIVDESKRMIDEINEKLDEYADELLDLPDEIQRVNRELMLLTMEECYALIKTNTRDMSELAPKIKEMRIALKRKILEMQHMEVVNVELYSWMQDIFGPDVMDIFDIEYDIEARKQEMVKKRDAMREEKARKESGKKAGGS